MQSIDTPWPESDDLGDEVEPASKAAPMPSTPLPPTLAPTPALAPSSKPKPDPGRLSGVALDTMRLHTREAHRLFTGQAGDARTGVPAIPGGRRFAAILKAVWHLSANDNPYADWLLLRMQDALQGLRAQMAEETALREREFDALRQIGLNLSLLASSAPVEVSLGFRSPYGYATAEAILAFDHHVRLVKTLVQKDRLGDRDGREAIRRIGRPMRALFLEPIRWERALWSEALLPLSRRDYLPGADAAARSRVQAAAALFGEVPRGVYTGQQAPRHTQRRVSPSQAEWRLLQQTVLSDQPDLLTVEFEGVDRSGDGVMEGPDPDLIPAGPATTAVKPAESLGSLL